MPKTSGDFPLISGMALGQDPGPVRCIFQLVKIHLSLYISLSAVAGQVMAQDHVSKESLVLGCWMLLLASGSAVFNNIQDREFDKLWDRTCHRVLVKKMFPLAWARFFALVLTAAGLAGLYLESSSFLPAVLGGCGLICYNGLYTPLKKTRTLTAMVPGILCGILPPAVGWTAVPAHMASTDPSGLVILMACMGIWQWPHYLLVVMKQTCSCRQVSGVWHIWTAREMACQVLVWTLVFSLGMALFVLKGWISGIWFGLFVFALALFLPFVLAGMLAIRLYSASFCVTNLAMLAFMASIILNRL